MESCRARRAKRQSGACRTGSFSRWVQREGKEMSLVLGGRETETGLRLIPVGTSLGETRVGAQESGPWVLSHERANFTVPPSPALQERVLSRWGGGRLGTRRGLSLGSPTPNTPKSACYCGSVSCPVLSVGWVAGWLGAQALILDVSGVEPGPCNLRPHQVSLSPAAMWDNNHSFLAGLQ